MSVRLSEGLTAAAFGAGDALITAKVARVGPMGIPWPVYYEAAGVAALFFGDKVGIDRSMADTVGLSALALAGARATRLGLAGKLMAGPKAWGGDGDVYSDFSAGGGGAGPRAAVRAMPGTSGGGFQPGGMGGGFSIWPVTQEAPGVAG